MASEKPRPTSTSPAGLAAQRQQHAFVEDFDPAASDLGLVARSLRSSGVPRWAQVQPIADRRLSTVDPELAFMPRSARRRRR